jgi:hypothetical protein
MSAGERDKEGRKGGANVRAVRPEGDGNGVRPMVVEDALRDGEGDLRTDRGHETAVLSVTRQSDGHPITFSRRPQEGKAAHLPSVDVELASVRPTQRAKVEPQGSVHTWNGGSRADCKLESHKASSRRWDLDRREAHHPGRRDRALS